jgi:hypothetical protein
MANRHSLSHHPFIVQNDEKRFTNRERRKHGAFGSKALAVMLFTHFTG